MGRNLLQSFPLSAGAVLVVAPTGGSAVFFVVINSRYGSAARENTPVLSVSSGRKVLNGFPGDAPRRDWFGCLVDGA